jgi:glycosyltransferase involved in cell wall biosynthesis
LNCLFLFSDSPLTDNYAGGGSRYAQAFLALHRLGIQVNVVRLLSQEKREHILQFEAMQEPSKTAHYQLANNWHDLTYQLEKKKQPRFLPGMIRNPFIDPIKNTFPEIEQLTSPFKLIVGEVQPDFILAEMNPAGALVYAANMELPWIYGHHDWQYRLSRLAQKELGTRHKSSFLRSFARTVIAPHGKYELHRRAEERIAVSATAIKAASPKEAEELESLGAKNVRVVETTYEAVPAPPSTAEVVQPMRIIHLGNLRAQANLIGLTKFLRKVYPEVRDVCSFKVIGKMEGAKAVFVNELREAEADILGHVLDLGTVLRPFDIAIIPYEHNTGTRTKVPMLFNYAQVVVATKASVAGMKGLRDGGNCLLTNNLDEFPSILRKLADDPQLRKRIGLEAKATFDQQFTLDAELPVFRELVSFVKTQP